MAWNDLYEQLAQLFVTLAGGGWVLKPLALWHSQTMDRAKRQLLKATVEHLTSKEVAQFPKLQEAVKWIVDETERLEDARNNAIHLPLLLLHDGGRGLLAAARERGIHVPDVMVYALNNHPRAKRMLEKDLLNEFRWCRTAVLNVRDFVSALDRAVTASGVPWPDLPMTPARRPARRPPGARQRLQSA